MKHILLLLFLVSCISPAFAQKAKAAKGKKARVKTEIAKLPSYNPIPETMPRMTIPSQAPIYFVKGMEGCQLQGLQLGCGRFDGTTYIADGIHIRNRCGPINSETPIKNIFAIESGTSAKYSGIPEDDNRYR